MQQYQQIHQQIDSSLLQSNNRNIEDHILQLNQKDNTLYILLNNKMIINGKKYALLLLKKLLATQLVKRIIIINDVKTKVSHYPLPPLAITYRLHWRNSVKNLYEETYHSYKSCTSSSVKKKLYQTLLVIYTSLLISDFKEVKEKYEQKKLVNIFGWIYCPMDKKITDLNLDLFFTYDELI